MKPKQTNTVSPRCKDGSCKQS